MVQSKLSNSRQALEAGAGRLIFPLVPRQEMDKWGLSVVR